MVIANSIFLKTAVLLIDTESCPVGTDLVEICHWTDVLLSAQNKTAKLACTAALKELEVNPLGAGLH